MSYEIQNYLPQQINLEEKYYHKLSGILATLFYLLDGVVKDSDPTKDRLTRAVDKWRNKTEGQLRYINNSHAGEITGLVSSIVPAHVKKAIEPITTIKLAQDFNIDTNNLVNAILGRYLAIIPTGVALIGALGYEPDLQNSNEDMEELATRNNNAIKRMVQTDTSQAVSNTIATIMLRAGYTEYLAGNEDDDRVRELHREQNDFKTWHSLLHPPSTGYPGTEYNCRCRWLAFR